MNLPVIGAEEQKQKIAERRALIEQRLQQRQQDLNVVLPYVMQKAMPSQPQAPGQPTVPTPPQTPVPAPAPAVPPSRPGQPSGRAAPRPAAGAPAPSPRAAQILQAYRAMPNAVKVSLKKMTRGPQGRPITRWDSLTEAERAWLRAQGVAP
jgi:hypothetical protein